MDYRMAVRTKRDEIFGWIYHVPSSKLRHRCHMVNLHETCRYRTVPHTHFQAASLATSPMYRDRGRTVPAVPFIAIGLNRLQRPLWIPDDIRTDTFTCIFCGEDRNNCRSINRWIIFTWELRALS